MHGCARIRMATKGGTGMSKGFGKNGEAATYGISISADRTPRVHLPRRRGTRRKGIVIYGRPPDCKWFWPEFPAQRNNRLVAYEQTVTVKRQRYEVSALVIG